MPYDHLPVLMRINCAGAKENYCALFSRSISISNQLIVSAKNWANPASSKLVQITTLCCPNTLHPLQVNHSPSFATDSQLDWEVKDALLTDALTLLNLVAIDHRRILEEDKRVTKERLLQKHQPCPKARLVHRLIQPVCMTEVMFLINILNPNV